jgi:hypothetical protein
MDYESAKELVHELTGQTDNILSNYKEIVEKARKQYAESIEDMPDDERSFTTDLALKDSFIYHMGDREYTISPLPNKKATADDIFVFQKANKL